MQRARLLDAVVSVVDELGWSDVTVAEITARARVSRRTFYVLFANREDCLLAMLEDAVGRVERDLAAALVDGSSWLERVRTGLWAILGCLDRDPALARVCVVQSARGSRRVLQARQEILARLAEGVDQGRSQSARAAQAPVLTAEGLVGAAMAIVYKRLLDDEGLPLGDLHAELVGMIVLPYLGWATAGRQCKRRAPRRSGSAAADVPRRKGVVHREDPLREVSMRLTYRTSRVLQAAAQHPGTSNRVIGERAGISDQGQVSKLLARLQRLGLLVNAGEGQVRRERNAWRLTPLGERVIHQLSLDTGQSSQTLTPERGPNPSATPASMRFRQGSTNLVAERGGV
jgi:AcrR family transcriptional regulator/DNA-binding MarR family transcriptional regulator